MGYLYRFSEYPQAIRKEGEIREALAAFFLSAPPPGKRTNKEKTEYKNALRRMAELETICLLQSAAVARPLRYGDVNALLYQTLKACRLRLEKRNVALECFVPDGCVCTAAEPRLLNGAVVRLIGAAVFLNPESVVYANVRHNKSSISISVKSENPITDITALKVAKAAARLHKGAIAVSGGTVGLSLRCGLSGAIGIFAAQDALDMLDNPMSPVNLVL